MRRIYLATLLLSLLVLTARGQQEVRIGQHRYTPLANVDALYAPSRSTVAAASKHQQLLVQFRHLPTAAERKQLASDGIRLHEYYGSNTFAASVDVQKAQRGPRSRNIVAAFELRPEWKVAAQLAEGRVPAHAQAVGGQLLVQVHYVPTLAEADVRAALRGLGMKAQRVEPRFYTLYMQLRRADMQRLAQEPWVLSIAPAPMPQELFNRGGRGVIKANVLGATAELHGRGLTGRGVRVGIWDGNVEKHVDYGNRLHQGEFEMGVVSSEGHGMHVAGTVGGAGLLDPEAMGMAPEAELYTYNFNVQSNGMYAYQEMADAYERFGISITQNSYGIYLSRVCSLLDQLSYNVAGDAHNLDLLANQHPTLLHVFAAGNDQGPYGCGNDYYSSSNRQKNVLHVGAVDDVGRMTDFSSWGPMDDGRLLPTVCAKGKAVYSTLPGDSYGNMDGTSMATPGASGLMALLVERYRQLTGEEPLSALLRAVAANTADDQGRPGPDYQYGYGILNGDRAAEAMERGWYSVGSISQGDADSEYAISVPAGAKQLRVMLAWTDTVGKTQYDYGEPALINDLDLTVNGQQPWILDKDNPEAVAVRGRDSINNMEQVTIDNPSGSYTIRVSARGVSSHSQQYVVTYYIERWGFRLADPLGGEQLAPGDNITARWYDAAGPVTVELSYDGGQSYIALKRGVTASQVVVRIPTDAPSTGNALLRVSDGRSYSVCAAPFTIMGVAKGLELNASPCSTSGWELTWKPVDGATAYEVLRADVAHGIYVAMGTTADTAFDIGEEHISTTERNAFAIRAMAGNVQGRRSKGLLARTAAPLQLSGAALPFVEHFNPYPSRRLQTIVGKELSVQYKEMPPSAELGSHYISVKAKSSYGIGKDEENYRLKLRLCSLDLSQVEAGTPIILSFDMQGGHGLVADNNMLHVLVDDVARADMEGQAIHKPLQINEEQWRTAFYDLSDCVDSVVTVDIEINLLDSDCYLSVANIKVDRMKPVPDVQMLGVSTIASGNNLTESPVSVELFNSSAQTLRNLRVQYTVNGGEPVVEVIKELEPYVKTPYTFMSRANLRTANELGEAFTITATALLPGDANPADNQATTVVYNHAEVYTLAYAQWYSVLGMTVDTDPTLVKEVDGRLVFTDEGGAFGDYRSMNQSSVRFVPKDSTKVVQITFRQVDVEPNYDGLYIWANYGGTAPNSFPSKQPTMPPPTGVLSGQYANQTFVSEAPDGGICVTFFSDESSDYSGWVADVVEVPRTNLYSLALEPLAAEYRPDGMFDVSVRVKNHTRVVATNVQVGFAVDGAQAVAEFIPRIEPGAELLYTFEAKADLSEVGYRSLVASVLSFDTEMSDNRDTLVHINDRYCRVDTVIYQGLGYIYSVEMEGISYKKPNTPSPKHIEYFTGTEFIAYRQNPTATKLKVEVSEGNPAYYIGLWVDWDSSGTLAMADTLRLRFGQRSYALQLNMPSTAVPGKHRMRVALLDTAMHQSCADAPVWEADIKDFTLNLLDTLYPVQNELGLSNITLNSGLNLGSTEELRVMVSNASCNEVSAFDIAYTLNDGAPVTERANLIIPPFGEAEYTFSTTLDLSARGRYTVNISLPADQDTTNNEASITVHNVQPEPDGFYALNVSPSEVVRAGTLNGTSFDDYSFTLEAWVNVNPDRINNIFNGKNVLVTAVNDPQTSFPVNCLLVLFNGYEYYYTDANVIKPGTWQHVAVAVQSKNSGWYGNHPSPEVYIDGKPVKVNVYNEGTGGFKDKTAGKSFNIAPGLNGMIKAVRVWDYTLDEYEIAAGRDTLLRDAAGQLPVGCVAEFAFDEGPGNSAAMSGDMVAAISSHRTEASDSCIWVDPSNMLSTIVLAEQTEPATRPSRDVINAKVKHDADLSAIEGSVIKAWPNTLITLNDVPVPDTAVFDFSTGSISLVATDTLFGRPFRQNVLVSVNHDASPACELLSLSAMAAHNQGLSADAMVDAIAASNTIDLTGMSSFDSVVLTFSVSPGATLCFDGRALTSGISAINLSQPVMLVVKAADGKATSCYALSAAVGQSISFELASSSFTYGDAPVTLGATATSGLPVGYASTDNSVATVANGQLRFVGVGTATISAYQDGGSGYGPAAEVRHAVTVQPKAISVRPVAQTIAYGDPVPALQFEFGGLVHDADTAQLQAPAYKLYVDGQPYSPAMGFVPVGIHAWRPERANVGQQGSYTLTALDGQLNVSDEVETYTVTFTVTDGTNALPRAAIWIGMAGAPDSVCYTADAQGRVVLSVVPGSYAYTALMADHTVKSAMFDVANADLERTIVLLSLAHTLTYTADAHGAIHGHAVQRVPTGNSGTAVSAVPTFGYHFDRWNDGSTQNPRTDENITADLSFEAQFAINTYSVNYVVNGRGGTISGLSEQLVEHGADASAVTAVPNENYRFERWSDGVKDATRTDLNVQENIAVEAIFLFGASPSAFDLPYTQRFELSTEMPLGWSTEDNKASGSYGNWFVTNLFQSSFGRKCAMDDNFVMVETDGDENTRGSDVSLLSPWFNVANLPASASVVVAFDYIYTYYMSTDFILSYRTDSDAVWTTIGNCSSSSFDENRYDTTFTIAKAALGVASKLQLRWTYVGVWEFWAALDNIVISATEPTPTFNLTYLAGEHGLVNGALKVEQTKNMGETGDAVEAQPDEDYEFVKWSDGCTDNPRTDTLAAYVWAVYKEKTPPVVVPPTYALLYTASEHGRIDGLFYQPSVAEGSSGAPVTAVPDEGYRFVQWSDGFAELARMDTNVHADLAVEAQFELITYTLTYTATAGGTISGKATQLVLPGGHGEAVTAVADAGYTFVQWSDGLTEPTRIDSSITADVEFEAQFAINTYRLYYLSGDHGHIEGDSIQTLDYGSSGTAVTAVPDSGYMFVSWSDGSTDNPRTDIDVHDSLNVVARFELIRFELALQVLDESAQPVVGAQVTIGTMALVTDAQGMAIDTLVPGKYSYTVELQGFTKLRGEVELASDTLLKLALSKATGLRGVELESLSVYPNPTMGGIYVEGNGDIVRIFDMVGRLVLEQPVMGHTYVELSGLPAGSYIVRLGKAQAKVVKQ